MDELTSTANGPLAVAKPRNAAASSGVQALPAFCSRIARGIRSAAVTEWRGNLARPTPAAFFALAEGFFADFFWGAMSSPFRCRDNPNDWEKYHIPARLRAGCASTRTFASGRSLLDVDAFCSEPIRRAA